ncbi:MAG: flagellar export chaperone FliS [Proteobacteria bacterium]|nr:flagellar export chaperone FliS [Pseudomonadota bacterium]MCH8037212.1 flagellar export chaperone FliS [Pseudomonadota bacterium]
MNREPRDYGPEQVMAADPVTLVAMLYDKAVLSLKAAVQAIHKDEIEVRWKNSHRAREIINHLFMTLDLEKGGEIASNLEALYAYMLQRLLDVDLKNNARAAEEVIELLEPLRASWSELARTSADIKIDESDIVAVAAIVGEAAA